MQRIQPSSSSEEDEILPESTPECSSCEEGKLAVTCWDLLEDYFWLPPTKYFLIDIVAKLFSNTFLKHTSNILINMPPVKTVFLSLKLEKANKIIQTVF